MKLNSTTALMFHDWVRGKHEEQDYIFNELSMSLCMVYGTGSAQLYLMAMLGMIDAAVKTDNLHVLGMMPARDLEALIETFRDGGWHASKTRLEQVSNFWLQPSQKYSQQYTKSITGSTLDTSPKSKTAKKLGKDLKAGLARVKAIVDDPERGSFYEAFGASPFALKEVIEARDSYFNDHGSKARSKTTHGKAMKMSDLIYDAMIRRSCKFLLYDAIRQNKRVVYLLDDLDLSKVAYLSGHSVIPDSARIQSGSSEGKVPICTTELREIFRNWDYFSQHLKFYLDFAECKPPWAVVSHGQKDWALYARYRATKVLGEAKTGLSNDQRQCLQACIDRAEHDPALAIEKFHDARPSRFTKGASLHTIDSRPEKS